LGELRLASEFLRLRTSFCQQMMRAAFVVAVVGAISEADISYTQTPAGFVLAHCVHTIPSGAHVRELDSGDSLVRRLI
jgi:hypothetical protein